MNTLPYKLSSPSGAARATESKQFLGIQRVAPLSGDLKRTASAGLTQRLECDAYNVEVGGSNPSARTIPNDGLFHLKPTGVSEEFLERFLSSFATDPMSGCWLWLKSVTLSGYGQVSIYRRSAVAHRVSYELFVGRIPFGLTLDHLCRTRCCINPKHLDPVSRGENVRRGDAGLARGLQLRSKTICPRGHEYSGANLRIRTRVNGEVYRACRACIREQSRARRNSNTLFLPEVPPCSL